MRELKFRIWNTKKKEMYWNFFIGTIWYHNPYLLSIKTSLDDLIFQQFTGLKDRNEKDVYEGDIVSGLGFISEVVWEIEDSAFQIKSKTGGAFMNYDYVQNFEIIGNIFETPELIK